MLIITTMNVIGIVITVLCTLSTLHHINCAKILGIFPTAGPSHYFLGNALMKGLAKKGHDVTMVSPFIEKNPPKNGSYTDVVLTGFVEDLARMLEEINSFEMGNMNPFVFLPFVLNMFLKETDKTLGHPNVQDLINSNKQFDLVIVEQFNNDAQKGLASHFKAPLILFSSIGANSWVNHLVGNPAPPSYIPDALLSYSSHMTFTERVYSSAYNLYSQALLYLYMYPQQGQIYKKYFPNGPEFAEVLHNASIVLLNSHPSTNQPVPLVPNMIDIGGIHVKPPKKLPEDLQQFLDNAKEGVIYFSLGSNLRSSLLPKEKREALLKTFSKLKEKVLWKWEEDELPGQPSNVKLGKWLPQQDILAHPNVKLFITHGGLLSTTETVYHGVPVLAIPIAADQKLNAQSAVSQGFGLMLAYPDITEQALTERINELLSQKKYSENAKARSKIFHDRILDPLNTAIYWVEYVIRHGGAPHLRVAALDLSWYQYHLLDVIAVFALISILAIYVFYILLKKIVLSRFSSKKQKKMKKN